MNLLPGFRTLRPGTLAEAVSALSVDGAQALAGGTDLLPNLCLLYTSPSPRD